MDRRVIGQAKAIRIAVRAEQSAPTMPRRLDPIPPASDIGARLTSAWSARQA